jgi:hypothetical protein
MMSRKRPETRGNGSSSTIPIISRWPVTESPADDSCMRPVAALDRPAGVLNRDNRDRGRATAASARHGTCRAMLPACCCRRRHSVGVRQFAHADAVGTMTMARLKGGHWDGFFYVAEPSNTEARVDADRPGHRTT